MIIKIASRGDVWLVNIDPTKGSEINKTRPAIAVSYDALESQSWNFFENNHARSVCSARTVRQDESIPANYEAVRVV